MKDSFNINNVDKIIELLLKQTKTTENSINEIIVMIENLKKEISIQSNTNLYNEWEKLEKEIKSLVKLFISKRNNIDLTYEQYKIKAQDNDYKLIQLTEKSIEHLNIISNNLEKI